MVTEELFIEGKQVDLIPNTVTRTLQISDLGEVVDKQSNYSSTVKLPLTTNNVEIMDYLSINGNTSRVPYMKLRCDYVVNGIPLISNGYITIKSTSTYYECVIYDGILDLGERLKGKKVNELNFGDLNHYLTSQSYQDSFYNTSGYIYAVADFGRRVYANGGIHIQHQAPSLFVHTIWDKIMKEAGVNYYGDFFNNSDFRSEVITPMKGYEPVNSSVSSTNEGSASSNFQGRNATSFDMIQFEDKFTFESGSFNNATIYSNGDIRINKSAQYHINIDISHFANDTYVRFNVKLNGRNIQAAFLPEDGTDVSFDMNLTLSEGDRLEFWLHGSDTGLEHADTVGREEENINDGNQPPTQTIDDVYSVSYSASFDISMESQVGGHFIDFSEFTTNMNQLDFVKDVMHRYGLVLKPIRNTPDYQFIQLEELLNDRQKAEDWSDKIKNISKENYTVNYAKNNTATYNYPKEIAFFDYDGVLSIDNEVTESEKEFFSSPYEIPRRLRTFKNKDVYSIPLWEGEYDDDLGQTVYNVEETPVKLMRLTYVDDNMSVYYFDNTNSINIDGPIPVLGLQNMEMQYYLNVYYKVFRNVINSYREVDAELYLDSIDIYELDFFKLKFLEQTGKYYYLNRVRNSPNKVSSARLIEIGEFASNQPISALGTYSKTIGFEYSTSVSLESLMDYSDPEYFDPEFDSPTKLKIINGFNPDTQIINGSDVLTTPTIIDIADLDLKVKDLGNRTTEHTHRWQYEMMDEGSGKWSEVRGTIEITVREYNNRAPIANAGEDSNHYIDVNGPSEGYLIPLDGRDSVDYTGEIVSYSWLFQSKPTLSNATIQRSLDDSDPTAAFYVPNENSSLGEYTLKLTVTDEFGLSATDTVTKTIYIGGDFEVAPTEPGTPGVFPSEPT